MSYVMIPMCYFPSTVLWFNTSFCSNIEQKLYKKQCFPYKVCSSLVGSIDFFKRNHHKFNQLNLACKDSMHLAKILMQKKIVASENLLAVYAEIYNAQRFAEISVVVVDDVVLGRDLLEHVSVHATKKVAIIDTVQQELADHLLQSGLLDVIIFRDEAHNLTSDIDTILTLQRQYFQTMTQSLLRILAISPPKSIESPTFVAFFNAFCKDKRIEEHYLLDTKGQFLLLDKTGTMYIMNTDSSIIKITEQKVLSPVFYYELYWEELALTELLSA